MAFGYLEGAVVVYLLYIVYPDGFIFPLRPVPPLLLAVEVGREIATLAMLVAAAYFPGGKGRLKFARFLYTFGLWDLFYYVALRIVLGWPASLFDWDILFLIPVPWLAPVSAPAAVAALFIAVGAGGIWRRGEVTIKPWQWLLTGAGAFTILATFFWNGDDDMTRKTPAPYPWLIFGAGFAATAVAAASAFIRRKNGR